MTPADRDALLAVTLTPGLGAVLTRRCLEAFGSASAVLAASVRDVAGVEGIGLKRAGEVRAAMGRVLREGAVAREAELIAEWGATLLVLGEPEYPALLRHISDPPVVLYARGRLDRGDALALAIVGARQCTGYGREQSARFASLCAQAGLCIISGGAYGVDAAAHRAALRIGGRTVAVLGSGLANPYPQDHAGLFDEIAGEGGAHGAVVSELPMLAPPLRENFPSRNRIISGLALGVLVVEAPVRSGSLITARLAAEDHGREVMAVPGRVDSAASAGCHKLIREGGATLVTNAADVLDQLGEAGQTLKAGLAPEGRDAESPAAATLFDAGLTPSQRAIVEALREPCALDQLAAKTSLPVSTLQADLTLLQIRGLVAREGPNFSLRAGRGPRA